jgi:hypothetical protein
VSAHAARNAVVSALLGLPAALLAHTFVFGSSHAFGGWLHPFAVQLGAGFATTAAVLLGLAAARGNRNASLSAGTLLLAAAAWFATFEFTESAHAIPVLLCALAIAIAGAICALAVSAYTHTVRAIAGCFSTRVRFTSRAFHLAFSGDAFNRRRTFDGFALFSRPPPVLS